MIKSYKQKETLKKGVYLVEDLKGNLLVAKIFPKNENRYTSIYLHEIEALKKLQHQNIVEITNNGEYDEGYYILFKYIDGEDFVNKFKNLKNTSVQCSFFKAIIKILETLDYIHSHDFIHKDIKPNNILVTHNSEPYILDFGTTTISNTLTKTQQELTLWYASPEQKNNQDIDRTSDLYSFGITLIETLVEDRKFELFTKQKVSLNELIEEVTLFNDGKNEELKNILKQLTYQERSKRYQRAKDVIKDIKTISNFLNCYNEYELNIDDRVKSSIQNDYELSAWKVLVFIQEKLDKEIKYIQYGKDREKREEIKIATSEFIFNCGIKNEENFYVYSYSRRVPDSVKQHGHIIDDKFIVTDGRPKKSYNSTYGLIDKLQRLEEKKNKKKNENKAKKSFLEKANTQLKIERTILDEKDITLFGQNIEHKKAKKELIVKIVNLSNVKITEKHLKDKSQNEKFVQDLFSDGFIDDPNNEKIDEYLLKMLNGLIESYFFESNRKDISQKLFNKLDKEQKKKINNKYIEKLLVDKYKEKKQNFDKLVFNAQRIFDMYPEYLIKLKEDSKYFASNDNVFIESINKKDSFNEKFVVKNIDVSNEKIILNYSKEISRIPKELEISFDYKVSSRVLNKQEFSLRDLRQNKTIMENLLLKITNPQALAPKRRIPKCEEYHNSQLDENQKEAVDKALSLERGEYLLIQGPPGTGKTTVITEILEQILSQNKLAKILVTSQSNQAVDNVLEKICKTEDKIVRFGKDTSKFSDMAKKYHEELVFDNYLQNVRTKLKNDKTNYFVENECLEELHKKWKHQILQGDKELQELLFKKIRIIFGTLVGISSWQDFRDIEFDYIIVDEAGRATLPELMIPLRRGKRFILVGDHKQLPPIIDSEVLNQMEKKSYEKKDLEITLFEELFEKIKHKDFKHFLQYNYRSDKNIAKIYSDTFYKGEIQTKDFLQREHGLDFDKKVYFYSTSKLNKRFETQSGTGKQNDKNRDIIIDILEKIEEQAMKHNIKKSIGVITPYLAQRNHIRRKFNPKRKNFKMTDINIDSVDAFQGSDRDIIIYDIVRSPENGKGNIEFVADEKRLNVALSRTKELLFIVGDADFIYNASIKEKENPFKIIIEMLSKDRENYEIKELKNEQ